MICLHCSHCIVLLCWVVDSDVPLQLTPLPDGEFQWLGTRTLMFKPTYRFPMATQYSVVVCVSNLYNRLLCHVVCAQVSE
jgi:hypothetical protein